MKIGLIGNVKKIGDASVIENLVLSLRECGHFVTMFSAYHEINGVDLVIVLGGDGAILHAATVAAPQGIALMGVNYGHLGFLTELEKEEINNVLHTLKPNEENVLRLRFGLNGEKPMSLKEVGDVCNLTKEHIRQIEKHAILRMQHVTRARRLESYVS